MASLSYHHLRLSTHTHTQSNNKTHSNGLLNTVSHRPSTIGQRPAASDQRPVKSIAASIHLLLCPQPNAAPPATRLRFSRPDRRHSRRDGCRGPNLAVSIAREPSRAVCPPVHPRAELPSPYTRVVNIAGRLSSSSDGHSENNVHIDTLRAHRVSEPVDSV